MITTYDLRVRRYLNINFKHATYVSPHLLTSVLRALPCLAVLQVWNVWPLSGIITALRESHSLRSLTIFLEPAHDLFDLRGLDFLASLYRRLPPLESVRIKNPHIPTYPLLSGLQSSLREISVHYDWQDDPYDHLKILLLSFPVLECLYLHNITLQPGPFRRFIGRHRRTLRELNVTSVDALVNLRWVVRIIENMVGYSSGMEDDMLDERGNEVGSLDESWATLLVNEFGLVLRDDVPAGVRGPGHAGPPCQSEFDELDQALMKVTQLRLSFPETNQDGNAINEFLTIRALGNVFDLMCMTNMEKLSLVFPCHIDENDSDFFVSTSKDIRIWRTKLVAFLRCG